ncbi:helix-turn-helix domain-containing protein [Gordonia sp. Z-3]|uniref:helix-turn-helix domain-containing protein n=1 Tax=Gordonia sp. Z-3 TaxID=3115408 RepID=UPI002E2B25B1|nr:helix-turn-helix domain-containing protein [Gordonia sp. Z-3]MCK5752245.1 helix-turn-helix domain-containing protein [Mycobacterium sp.]MED5802107.1 helix-turn-helix domain-containing protein [Gordonia sp. Z-3]
MHDEQNPANTADRDTSGLAGAAASDDPARGLAAVRALRTLADRLEDVQVANARAHGWSWQSIAEVLQISRQAVHQKHAHREVRDSGPKGDTNNV